MKEFKIKAFKYLRNFVATASTLALVFSGMSIGIFLKAKPVSAHTFDTKVEVAETTSNPATTSYTAGSGTTLIVVGIATTKYARTGGAPTFDGVTMTLAASSADSGEGFAELWYLVSDITTGSSVTVSVPNTGVSDLSYVVSSYAAEGSGYSSIFDTSNNTVGNGVDPSISVTPSEADSVIVDILFSGYRNEISGYNRTLLYSRDTGSEGYGTQYYLDPPTSSTAMSWTQSYDDWAMVAAVFKEGVGPPGTPGTPTLTNVGTSSMTVNWTSATGASYYKIERCSGYGCSSFAQIATTSSLYYDDSVSAGTYYTYRIRATNSAEVDGDYSGTTEQLTVSLPNPPGSVYFVSMASTSADVEWSTAGTNAVYYEVERCSGSSCSTFAQIATTTSYHYVDSSLSPSTLYRYRIRSVNSLGDLSSYSSIIEDTTDSAPPGIPGTPTFTNVASTTMTVNWTSATGASYYKIERCFVFSCSYSQIATTSDLFYNDSSLSTDTPYRYRIRATNSAETDGDYSGIGTQTTLGVPGPPVTPTFTNVGTTTLTINWLHNQAYTNYYEIERCSGSSCSNFAQIATTSSLTYDDNVSAGTVYRYQIRAVSPTGDKSIYSGIGEQETYGLPGTPGTPTFTNVASTTMTVNWTSGTNADYYEIERCSGPSCSNFSQIATTSSLTYDDSSLSPSTLYRYQIRTVNVLDDKSSYSGIGEQTTDAASVELGIPGDPTFTNVSTTTLKVNWTSATGASYYKIERCSGAGCSSFSQIATTSDLFYNDSGLTPSTTYRYRLRATDSGETDGDYSGVGTKMTNNLQSTSRKMKVINGARIRVINHKIIFQ